MNDKLDHFVLEYDHESGTALLAMTEADGGRIAEGGTLPYAVARGYDADARTWESIEPFDDVTHAKLRFEKECGRDYVPTGGKLYDDEFITLRWRRKDIADSLENDWGNFGFPIPATEKNVERAMDQLGNHIDIDTVSVRYIFVIIIHRLIGEVIGTVVEDAFRGHEEIHGEVLSAANGGGGTDPVTVIDR